MTRLTAGTRPLGRELFGTALFGFAVVAVFVVGSILWSMRAPLSGAVIANGNVAFASGSKTVQHLEGGIIKRFFVEEGDRVSAGALLLTLDDTAARARADELLSRIRGAAAEDARLRAERTRQQAISFDDPSLADRDNPDVAAILNEQRSLLAASRQNLETRRRILRARIGQLEKQNDGVTKQLTGTRTRLRLVRDEEASVAQLVAKGYARRPRLLAIRRTEAKLIGTEGELLATMARNRDAQDEVRLQIANLDTDRLEKIGDQLAKVDADRLDMEKRYRESLDRLKRTRITAPVDGVVLDIKFKTVGGVIQPGQPILDIAPVGDKLVIETRVRPTDVDEVSPGAPATVVFPAFPQRYVKRVPARVARVSADAFTDAGGKARYYTATIEIDRRRLAATLPGIRPEPGMPAEVYIATGARTLYDFLAEPVRQLFARALRES